MPRAAALVPAALVAAIVCAGFAGAALATPRSAGAQTPARGDTLRTPRDSARADSVRADSARTRADTVRSTAADSARRDSLVARDLRTPEVGPAARPPLFEQLGLDRLRLTAVGVSAGGVWPSQIDASRLYSVHADYGEIAPGVRVVFVVSYWTSRYGDAATRAFARKVGEVAGTPAGGDSVRIGRIRASDVALAADGRWRPGALRGWRGVAGAVRPFLSGGVALHFLDVEGAPLSDTFVERALDGVAVGLAGGAGVDLAVLPNFQLTMQARYDLFSGARFPSLRAGGSYVFEPARARLARGRR